MGRQYIRQPGGKTTAESRWVIWESMIDKFVLMDATAEEVVAYEANQGYEIKAESVRDALARIQAGKVLRGHMTYEQAVAEYASRHGGKQPEGEEAAPLPERVWFDDDDIWIKIEDKMDWLRHRGIYEPGSVLHDEPNRYPCWVIHADQHDDSQARTWHSFVFLYPKSPEEE